MDPIQKTRKKKKYNDNDNEIRIFFFLKEIIHEKGEGLKGTNR
jgi:hypothetical protein